MLDNIGKYLIVGHMVRRNAKLIIPGPLCIPVSPADALLSDARNTARPLPESDAESES